MTRNRRTFDTSDKDDLENRLNDINKRLGREDKSKTGESSNEPQKANMGAAFQMSTEFIAAILVGAAIGYGLDWLVGTKPWGLIGFVMLGFVAGVMNVLRAAGELTGPVDLSQPGSQDGLDKE